MIRRIRRACRPGQAQVEYGLILAFVSIALVGALLALYLLDRELFGSIIDAVKGLI